MDSDSDNAFVSVDTCPCLHNTTHSIIHMIISKLIDI